MSHESNMHHVLVPVHNDLNLGTQLLVVRFAGAMAEKLHQAERKGRGGWERPDWQDECIEQLYLHLRKGDPVDVANFCAFMWHHKWSTGTPTVLTQDLGENDQLLLLTSEVLSAEQAGHIKAHFDAMLQDGPRCIVAHGFENAVVIRRPAIQEGEPDVSNEHQNKPTAICRAHVDGVDCPHCDNYIMGFVGDPRGKEITCDDCGQSFIIDQELDLS